VSDPRTDETPIPASVVARIIETTTQAAVAMSEAASEIREMRGQVRSNGERIGALSEQVGKHARLEEERQAREAETRRLAQAARDERFRWARSVLTPQTIVQILVILAALAGVEFLRDPATGAILPAPEKAPTVAPVEATP